MPAHHREGLVNTLLARHLLHTGCTTTPAAPRLGHKL